MIVAYVLMSVSYAYVMMIGVNNLFKGKTEVNDMINCLDEYVAGE